MNKVRTAKEVGDSLLEAAYERKQDPKVVVGIPTGFGPLDRLTHGFEPEPRGMTFPPMIVLAARPNVGKSAIAGQIHNNVALWARHEAPGKLTRLASFEMTPEAYQMRMACSLARVPIASIETGFVSSSDFDRWVAELDALNQLPIEFIGRVPVDELMRFIARDNACVFWTLDHMGIVPGVNDNQTGNNRARISTYLAEICHRYAPGLLISHLNRECEKREDKRPILADLYGADQIGQDADYVFALYRGDMYKKLPEEERDMPQGGELIILKARGSGAGRTVHLLFNPPTAQWIVNPEIHKEAA